MFSFCCKSLDVLLVVWVWEELSSELNVPNEIAKKTVFVVHLL